MQADDLGIGTIRVTQIKAKLDIPLHPLLERVLSPREHKVGPIARQRLASLSARRAWPTTWQTRSERRGCQTDV